jgi:hypothetical protein
MPARYTTLAWRRMRQRGVTPADVDRALAHPNGSPQPGNQPGTIVVAAYRPGGGTLKVVLDAADQGLVVTVMT